MMKLIMTIYQSSNISESSYMLICISKTRKKIAENNIPIFNNDKMVNLKLAAFGDEA